MLSTSSLQRVLDPENPATMDVFYTSTSGVLTPPGTNEKLSSESFSNNFDEHALAPLAVELTVKNLFPRAKVEFALRDRDDDFAAHDLTLEVSVRVVFAGAIMAVLRGRFVRRKFLQPHV